MKRQSSWEKLRDATVDFVERATPRLHAAADYNDDQSKRLFRAANTAHKKHLGNRALHFLGEPDKGNQAAIDRLDGDVTQALATIHKLASLGMRGLAYGGEWFVNRNQQQEQAIVEAEIPRDEAEHAPGDTPENS